MIDRSELLAVGTLGKPHGVKGEITALTDVLSADDFADLKYVFVETDGLLVPFTVLSARAKGSESVLLTLKGIANETQAAALSGKTLYAERIRLGEAADDDEDDSEGFYLDDLVGYEVVADGVPLGKVSDYDDSTDNVLFVIETHDGRTILVPAADDFIDDVDTDNKRIEMTLPQGLVNL